jgi:hypothetical protein
MRLVETCCFAAAAAAILAVSPAFAQTPEAAPAPAQHPRTLTRFAGANEVQVREFAGYVRVIPENRTDVAVGFVRPGVFRAPEYRVSRRRLIIDGNVGQIRSCRVNEGEAFEVTTRRQGKLSGAQLPVLELRVPQNAVVAASGALRMVVMPSLAANLRLDGCGDVDIARVENSADISVNGTQAVHLSEAGSAEVALAGAGDIDVGSVRNGLTLSIAGAGDFTAMRADGPTSIAVQGAGDVTIAGGHASSLNIVIAGGGDVTHNGSAERLDAVILGGGDVRVRHVEGEISRRVLGGGEVVVGR